MTDEEKWLSYYSNYLDKLVNLGLDFIDHIASEKNFNIFNTLPGLLYFRTYFQIIDAVSLNIRNGITEAPTRALIRTLTEYFFGAVYLCKNRIDFENKSLSIAYTSILEDEKGYAAFYKENIEQTLEKLKKDFNYKGNLQDTNLDYSSAKKHFEGILGHPDFFNISEEYKRTKNTRAFKRRKIVPWYSLFHGPIKLSDLAKNIDQFDLYETVYQEYSHDSHGSKVFRDQWFIDKSEMKLKLHDLRTPLRMREPIILTTFLTHRLFKKCTTGLELDLKELNTSIKNTFRELAIKDPGFEPIDVKNHQILIFDD